jgi:hypothetical protein
MVEVKKVRSQDASALAEASKRAFHSDLHCGAPPEPSGGPPSYDSPHWQRKMMRIADYYKIALEKAGGEPFVHPRWGHCLS